MILATMSQRLGSTNFDVARSPVGRIQGFLDHYRENPSYDGFEAVLMKNISVVSAEKLSDTEDGMYARAVFEVDVVPGLCNPLNNMHGGCVATVVDMATTMAEGPAAEKGFWEFGGVTRTLGVTILRPIKGGQKIKVDCIVRGMGRRMATITCTIREEGTGKVLALGEHGKATGEDQLKKSGSKL